MKYKSKDSINRKYLTFLYAIVNTGFFGATCGVFGYATVLMLGEGFRASEIGIIVALGNFLSMLFQPFIAGIADRSRRFTVQHLTLFDYGAALVACIIFLMIPGYLPAVAAVFVIIQITIKGIQPLVNAINGYYVNRGVKIDFGIPRSCGTLAYAAASAILGVTVKYFGTDMVLIIMIICLILSGIGLLLMPLVSEPAAEEEVEEKENKEKKSTGSILAFVKKYPYFCLTFAGMICLFVVHNMTESYMIQILGQWGGDASNQGTALTIAALAEFIPMLCFGFLHKKLGTRRLLSIAGICYILRAAIYLMAGAIFHVYLGQLFQAITYALLIPASVIYANECMEPEDKVMGQAVMSGSIVAGGMIASLLGGFLVDYLGVKTMLAVCVAFGAAGAAFILMSFRKRK